VSEFYEFLKESGADTLNHSGRTLFDHLVGVEQLLKKHGRSETEQRAGLFHSIYGTEYYTKSESLNIQRDKIRELIGEQSELLAFLFCKTKGRTQRIVEDDWFCEPERTQLRWIEYCNLIEQNPDRADRWVDILEEKLEING